MIKNKDVQVFMENLIIEKKKAHTFFDLPERGFEPQIFSNFPAHDLKLRRPRSRQASPEFILTHYEHYY